GQGEGLEILLENAMKTLALAGLMMIAGGLCHAEQVHQDESAIQGVWRGTGPADKQYMLIFCGDSLIGLNLLLGTQESTFRLDQPTGTIDIRVYSLDGDTLRLTLADVNAPR